jgi:hypothetical protein
MSFGIAIEFDSSITQIDCLNAISGTVPVLQITAICKNRNSVGIWFSTEKAYKDVVALQTLTISGKSLQIRPFLNPIKKIFLRPVLPIMNMDEINAKLGEFGKILEPLVMLKCKDENFRHVNGATAMVGMSLENDTEIPEKISVKGLDGQNWSIFIQRQSQNRKKCYACKEFGHLIAACPKRTLGEPPTYAKVLTGNVEERMSEDEFFDSSEPTLPDNRKELDGIISHEDSFNEAGNPVPNIRFDNGPLYTNKGVGIPDESCVQNLFKEPSQFVLSLPVNHSIEKLRTDSISSQSYTENESESDPASQGHSQPQKKRKLRTRTNNDKWEFAIWKDFSVKSDISTIQIHEFLLTIEKTHHNRAYVNLLDSIIKSMLNPKLLHNAIDSLLQAKEWTKSNVKTKKPIEKVMRDWPTPEELVEGGCTT